MIDHATASQHYQSCIVSVCLHTQTHTHTHRDTQTHTMDLQRSRKQGQPLAPCRPPAERRKGHRDWLSEWVSALASVWLLSVVGTGGQEEKCCSWRLNNDRRRSHEPQIRTTSVCHVTKRSLLCCCNLSFGSLWRLWLNSIYMYIYTFIHILNTSDHYMIFINLIPSSLNTTWQLYMTFIDGTDY